MEATAKTMPAKQQKVSPMKMVAGQALKRMRAAAVPKKVMSRQMLQMYSLILPQIIPAVTKYRSIPEAATMLWPTSNPLIPAQMLIVFVLYMPNKMIQSMQRQLSQILVPNTHEKGGITSTYDEPEYTQINGITMKKGNKSLYLQGKSSMSSANPSKIVPRIVVQMAMCIVRLVGVDHFHKMTVTNISIIVKATAAAKPTHQGISFSPSLLPFLLISSPKIRFLSINYDILGMRVEVMSHPETPDTSRRAAIFSST